MRPTLFLLLLSVLSPTRALRAQDRRAELLTATSIRYPDVLRSAGIAGQVVVTVVVLPGDSVATDGVRIVSTPHPGFGPAVIESVRRWRYRAAMHGGSAVADTLRIFLTFEPGTGGVLTFGPTEVRALRPGGAGTWHGAVGPMILAGRGSTLTGARRDSAGIAAVRYIAQRVRTTPAGGAPIVCVTMHDQRGGELLTAAELAELQTPGVAFVHPGRCPPVFASMAYVVGRVIPPGNDPSRLVVLDAREFPEGWIVIRVESRYGNGKTGYDCAVRADPVGEVRDCVTTTQEVY